MFVIKEFGNCFLSAITPIETQGFLSGRSAV